MRKATKILLITAALFVLMQPLLAAVSMDGATGTVPGKHKDLFTVKTNRKFVGAKVEILASNGNVVTSQILQKRKVIIDFGDIKYGTYTIRISKGGQIKEFQYDKK
jgi:hypothetical protein